MPTPAPRPDDVATLARYGPGWATLALLITHARGIITSIGFVGLVAYRLLH